MLEPAEKRACAFIDGQNLFYNAKEAFGYSYPRYDVKALAVSVCARKAWTLQSVHFYTGVPSQEDDAFWNHFWTAKLAQMGFEGVHVFSRPLKYRNQTWDIPGGGSITRLVGSEKGIDVRLALDVVAGAFRGDFDIALIFSQDQDLSEVAAEIRTISKMKERWIKMASAFPSSPTSRNRRGINGTDWIKIERTEYEACLDPRDYRPKR